jgi:hypothetical protein
MVIRMDTLMPVPNSDDASLMGSDSGHFEVETARALVERLGRTGRNSTAEMLQELRRAFPHSPLAVRVRALEALRKS